MKKTTTTTTRRPVVKTKKTTTRKVVKAAAVKKPLTKQTTRAKAKTTVKPRGLKHHTKRLYHATPKFIHGMIAGALVGVLVVGILSTVTAVDSPFTAAATGCDAHGIGNNTKTSSTNNSAYKINGGTTTVTFDVVGKDCKLPVTMVVWKAPNGTNGLPYSAQTVYRHTVGTFSTGRHSMTLALPACYFQVDTVVGPKMVSGNDDLKQRMVAYMHGGTTSCTAKPVTPKTPTTPTTPTTPPTPPVVISVCDTLSYQIVSIQKADLDTGYFSMDTAHCTPPPVPTPTPTPTPTTTTPVVETTPAATTLPNTGAGAVITIGLLSVIGGIAFHQLHHRTKARQHRRAH